MADDTPPTKMGTHHKIGVKIAAMPTIGRLEPQRNGKLYRSFPAHPKCRIYYWYDEKELHVTGLRFTMMK